MCCERLANVNGMTIAHMNSQQLWLPGRSVQMNMLLFPGFVDLQSFRHIIKTGVAYKVFSIRLLRKVSLNRYGCSGIWATTKSICPLCSDLPKCIQKKGYILIHLFPPFLFIIFCIYSIWEVQSKIILYFFLQNNWQGFLSPFISFSYTSSCVNKVRGKLGRIFSYIYFES